MGKYAKTQQEALLLLRKPIVLPSFKHTEVIHQVQ